MLVANFTQRLEPFGAEMVIAAFALDGFDDYGRDVGAALFDNPLDLRAADLLIGFDLTAADRFGEREVDSRGGDSGPLKFREILRFARISVGETERVATAAMKGAFKVENVGPAFATPSREVLAHLPIHSGFQSIFHSRRAAFDEEIAIQGWQAHDPVKGFDKVNVVSRINVGIRNFDACGLVERFFYLRLIKVRMVEADGERSIKPI